MKKLIRLVIVLIGIFGCSGYQGDKSEQTDSEKWNLGGFWSLSSSEYKAGSSSKLCADFEAIAISNPKALGSHFVIEGDSISLFRYPFEYYGTFKYVISGDSLFIKAGRNFTNNFAIQKPDENSLTLNFEEEFNPTCSLSAEAKYERFTPDSEIIKKLMRDTISYDSIIGKWWYLRKKIGFNDGSEPTILNFPKGMPDSIFVSQKLINKNVHQPFIELELDNKIVKMLIKNPREDSFILKPEFKRDEILFSNFIYYGEPGRMDTIYHAVTYWR